MNIVTWVLSLVLTWEYSHAAECPLVLCHNFEDNSCTQSSGSTILLRAHHCASTTYCNLTSALVSPGAGTIPCVSFDNSNNIYDVNDYRECGTRLPNHDLALGSYPKVCTNDRDCLLKDGSTNMCQCGVDGQKYCVPDLSSRLFTQYWQECSDNDNLVYRNDYYYWTWYLNYYTLIVSAPACAWSVSIELLTFRYLDAFLYQGSASLLTFAILLAFG